MKPEANESYQLPVLQDARQMGGVYIPVWSADDIEKAVTAMRQAHAFINDQD